MSQTGPLRRAGQRSAVVDDRSEAAFSHCTFERVRSTAFASFVLSSGDTTEEWMTNDFPRIGFVAGWHLGLDLRDRRGAQAA